MCYLLIGKTPVGPSPPRHGQQYYYYYIFLLFNGVTNWIIWESGQRFLTLSEISIDSVVLPNNIGVTGRVIKNTLGLPWWLIGKESACQCRDMGSIPGPKRSHMLWSNYACIPQLLRLFSRAWEPHLLSPCTTATRVCMPQSPCSATREATTMRSPCTTPEE